MRSILIASLAALACEPNASARASQVSTADASSRTTAQRDSMAPAKPRIADTARREDTAIVRGLYVLRWAAQSPARMKKLIAIADSTEVNALVIDIKDEFGLNYKSSDTLVTRNAGTAGTIPNLRAMIDTMKAHGVVPIARIVVFKDSVAARLNPQHTIRKADGGVWRDKEGLAWVSAYDPKIWGDSTQEREAVGGGGLAELQWGSRRFLGPS